MADLVVSDLLVFIRISLNVGFRGLMVVFHCQLKEIALVSLLFSPRAPLALRSPGGYQ